MNRSRFGVAVIAALLVAATPALGALSSSGRGSEHRAAESHKFVFFASDGMRQDLIEKYLDRKSTPRGF